MRRTLVAVCLIFAASVALVGCSSEPPPARRLPQEVVPSDAVIFSKPIIDHDGDRLEVTGTVRRAPGYTGTLFGHVNIEIIDHDGYLIDNVPAALNPRMIPSYGDQTSSYHVLVQMAIPAQARARVSFSDDSKPTTQPGSGMPGIYMEKPAPTGAGGGAHY